MQQQENSRQGKGVFHSGQVHNLRLDHVFMASIRLVISTKNAYSQNRPTVHSPLQLPPTFQIRHYRLPACF
jgi:hypothetical protein